MFFERFPHLNELLFIELDNESLVTCKEVDKTWNKFIDGQKLLWIRMIEKQIGRLEQYPETWMKVTSKTQVKNVQELALAVNEFYNRDFRYIDSSQDSWTDWTPIHIIAACAKLDLCQFIFEKVTEKNPPIKYGITPLHMAAYSCHFNVYKHIMGFVSDKNPLDSEGTTPLLLAADKGNFEVCKLIVTHVDDKNHADNCGHTPLHSAALAGYFEICKLFLENVDTKNPADNNGITPLHYAAQEGHLNICKLIIDL